MGKKMRDAEKLWIENFDIDKFWLSNVTFFGCTHLSLSPYVNFYPFGNNSLFSRVFPINASNTLYIHNIYIIYFIYVYIWYICMYFKIFQLWAKFQTAMVSRSRLIWITNSRDRRRVWTVNLLHTKYLPNPLGHTDSYWVR